MSDMPKEVFVQCTKSFKGDEYSMSPCAINPETILGSMVEQRYIRADLAEAKQAPVDVEGLKKPIPHSGGHYQMGWNDCLDKLASKDLLRTADDGLKPEKFTELFRRHDIPPEFDELFAKHFWEILA